jgi:hypothetical protein
MESYRKLIEVLHAKPNPPAKQNEIEEFERASQFSIPPDVRRIYEVANGFKGDRRLSFLPLFQGSGYIEMCPSLGMLSLTDSNDSDTYCVLCAPPLSGYVVYLRHDADTDICFRNIESFVDALLGLQQKEKWRIYDLIPEIKNDDGARSARDTSSGLEILIAARDSDSFIDEIERGFAIRFGLWLLSSKYVELISKFLEDGDSGVREDARLRLKGLNTPASMACLARHFDKQ